MSEEKFKTVRQADGIVHAVLSSANVLAVSQYEYEENIQRDPIFADYVEKIGEIFCNHPPRVKMGNLSRYDIENSLTPHRIPRVFEFTVRGFIVIQNYYRVQQKHEQGFHMSLFVTPL